MSDSHIVHFDKHICHEKVTTTGDYAVQAILLTGKVYLKRKNRGFITNITCFCVCVLFKIAAKEKVYEHHKITYCWNFSSLVFSENKSQWTPQKWGGRLVRNLPFVMSQRVITLHGYISYFSDHTLSQMSTPPSKALLFLTISKYMWEIISKATTFLGGCKHWVKYTILYTVVFCEVGGGVALG